MNSGVSRSWLWAGCFTFATLVVACGGGEDGSDSFKSDDGVVSVDVPPGAAPDGFSGSVSQSDPSDLGVDTSGVELMVLVYEFGPDGTEFDEPVNVTFRIPSALGGFDPDAGLPITLLVIEDGAGGFEQFEDSNSYFDGDVLVVEGTTTHFSKAVIAFSGVELYLSPNPPGLEKPVGSTFTVSLSTRSRANEEIEVLAIGKIDFAASGALEVVNVDSTESATIRCAEKGPGSIEAMILGAVGEYPTLAAFAQVLTGAGGEFIGSLSLEIECVESSGTTSTTSTTEPPTGSDPPGDQKDGADSTQVEEGEGVDGGDITHVSHVPGPDGSGINYFDIDVVGNGKQTAEDASNYLIQIEVHDPGGEWQSFVEFRFGDVQGGKVWLGPKESGRDTVDGATVTAEWLDDDTLRICVDGGATRLNVETMFLVEINVFNDKGHYYDGVVGEGVGAN